MDCFRCEHANPEGQKFCGQCGSSLDFAEFIQETIRASLKDSFKDQKVVENDIAENVANRLIGWAKIAAVLIAVPLAIVSVVLSINLHDLSKTAEQARTDVQNKISEMQGKIKEASDTATNVQNKINEAGTKASKVTEDADTLRKQLDTAKPKLAQLDAIQEQVNDKLSLLRKNVDDELKSLNSKVDNVEKRVGCADDLKSCPAFGCAAKDSPQGIQNAIKKNIPRGNTKGLTFADFRQLQTQAAQLVGEGKQLTQTERARLQNLNTAGGNVSEGDLVRLVGYLLIARVEARESVNCQIPGPENSDFHLALVSKPDDTEFSSVVAEMIPQDRLAGWTAEKLNSLTRAHQVMVDGQLFYDNSHRANGDPQNPIMAQPRRISLWEIHPVTSFLVCMQNTCDPGRRDQWTPLENI